MNRRIRHGILHFTLALALFSGLGCKKTVDKVKEDLVMNLITNNLWLISNFKEGSTDLTSSFSSYEFKFNDDGSVYGRMPGKPDAVGTWKGNSEDMSITSSFPSGPAPLEKLNGKWMITKTTLSSVKSNRVAGSVTYLLDLQKK